MNEINCYFNKRKRNHGHHFSGIHSHIFYYKIYGIGYLTSYAKQRVLYSQSYLPLQAMTVEGAGITWDEVSVDQGRSEHPDHHIKDANVDKFSANTLIDDSLTLHWQS